MNCLKLVKLRSFSSWQVYNHKVEEIGEGQWMDLWGRTVGRWYHKGRNPYENK